MPAGEAPPLILNDTKIVNEIKLLGVIISSDWKWNEHIHYVNKKAAKRLYYLRCLKRSGLTQELIDVFLSLIRSIYEYACQVWSTCLTKELSGIIESIQERALTIIQPGYEYDKESEYFNIPCLKARMKGSNHKLNLMLPEKRKKIYNL